MELPGGSPLAIPPVRYIVGGASHPVISATAACPPRDWREYASCCPAGNTGCQQIQSRDLVSRLTAQVQRSARPYHQTINVRRARADPLERVLGMPRGTRLTRSSAWLRALLGTVGRLLADAS